MTLKLKIFLLVPLLRYIPLKSVHPERGIVYTTRSKMETLKKKRYRDRIYIFKPKCRIFAQIKPVRSFCLEPDENLQQKVTVYVVTGENDTVTQHPVDLIIDTGAETTVIPENIAQLLKLERSGTESFAGAFDIESEKRKYECVG
eukprot:TRINITY_DN18310_c0_g1_i1.p1 TRINITY_DN18310_c0_g1~~TRINITY_DN18310_c0_g1_i1.p1  ORF type:complete len:145 (+),score=16.68 TRINITY_DN18310_c0_g1_i1:90-524(+)